MKTLKNKNGVTLLIVVMYFLVIVLLLGGLFAATIGNFKNQNTASAHTEVFYSAESGINLTVLQIEEKIQEVLLTNPNVSEFYGEIDQFISNLNHNLAMDGSNISVSIVPDPTIQYRYLIKSTGQLDGVERTLGKVIQLDFTYGDGFSAEAGLTFIENLLSIGNSNITDIITYSESTSYSQTTKDLPLINFGNLSNCNVAFIRCRVQGFFDTNLNITIPTSTLSEYNGKQINSLTITGDVVINEDILISTRSLNIINAKFTGTGKLEIYVKNPSINLIGSIGNVSNPEKFLIYGDGTGDISFNQLSEFYGSIMLDNIGINAEDINNFLYNGFLISNVIGVENPVMRNSTDTSDFDIVFKNTFSPYSNGIFYFPNGNFYSKNNFNLVGAIIAKNIYIGNTSSITYDPNLNTEFPFELADPTATETVYTGGGDPEIEYTFEPTTELDN